MAGQAEVAAMLRSAVAEMESLGIVDDNRGAEDDEETPEMKRCSFEPKNPNIEVPTDMNEFVLSYFESLNNMNRRIIAVQREAMAENKDRWHQLTPEEQDRIVDDSIVYPSVRKQYDEPSDAKRVEWFPVLKLAHGVSSSSSNVNLNHRDSITSVSEFFGKDQFSSPWSWETQSQQGMQLLEEGKLEAEINKAIEEQNKNPEVPKGILHHRASMDYFLETKDSSHSGSGAGSGVLKRKAYLDADFDSHGASTASSIHGSKTSLNMPSSKGSLSSEHLNNVESETVPQTENPVPADAGETQVAETGSAPLSDNQLSSIPENPKDLDIPVTTESNDLMEFLHNW